MSSQLSVTELADRGRLKLQLKVSHTNIARCVKIGPKEAAKNKCVRCRYYHSVLVMDLAVVCFARHKFRPFTVIPSLSLRQPCLLFDTWSKKLLLQSL